MKGQNGERRIALAQCHPQSSPAEASGAGQCLLVAGVEHQDVVAAGRPCPGIARPRYRRHQNLSAVWTLRPPVPRVPPIVSSRSTIK